MWSKTEVYVRFPWHAKPYGSGFGLKKQVVYKGVNTDLVNNKGAAAIVLFSFTTQVRDTQIGRHVTIQPSLAKRQDVKSTSLDLVNEKQVVNKVVQNQPNQ